jgi:Zn-dependent protease/CBS domain-containing protein
MGGSVRLGKILDIEVRLDYSWFVVFFLFAWILSRNVFPVVYDFGPGTSWVLGITASLMLFASVLVHELGHSLVARRYGIGVSGITLFMFGGVAQIKGEPNEPKEEFFIAAIGPVVSFVIGIVCLGISWLLLGADGFGPVGALFNYLGTINIVLAVFNLVPGFPLDGGRILRAGIWHFTGNLRKATRWAARAGQAFAWFLIAVGLFQVLGGNLGGLWLAFIGWFLNNAAEASYQQLLLRRALTGIPVSDVLADDVPAIDADAAVPEFVDAYLLRYDHTVYPVMRNGELAGVVSVDDVKKLDRDLWPATAVGAIAQPVTSERIIDADEDAWDALTRMMEQGAPMLLVMRNGRLAGIVSRDCIARLVQRKLRLGLAADAVSSGAERRSRPSRDRGLAG